jgi:hypothetical protein
VFTTGGIDMTKKLSQEQRLALVVAAEVARVRAQQAQERAAHLGERTRAVSGVLDRFIERRGRPPEPGELAIGAIVAQPRAQGVTTEDIEAVAHAHAECARTSGEVVAAMRALAAVWKEAGGRTVLDWVGVDRATFERAVEQALKEG